jgi:hypothetical protein
MRAAPWIVIFAVVPSITAGQDTTRSVTVGGFVDAYYAWDVLRPPNLDRSFTTQPARHNEFNVNLAFVEMKLAGPHTRGRVSLQAGTSVQSNYAAEPRVGNISGPDLSRHIQEATAGVRVSPRLWIDGGIYLSHIGQESWISRDNPTYSRSLIADFSPYYEAGVKATWTASTKLTAQLHVLNGWQNISETNSDKALGVRLDYAASRLLALGYANFIGNEMPDSVPSRLRVFNEGFAALSHGSLGAWLTFDHGLQARPGGGHSTWYGAALIGRVKVSPTTAVVARVERYVDPDGVIVVTGTPSGFRVSGASFGLDVAPFAGAVWRVEARGFHSRDAIYPKHLGGSSDGDAFFVSSLALTFQ